jgi:ABC-2 type transport system permease protein
MRHLLAREWWRQLVLIGACVWLVTLIPAVLWGRVALGNAIPESRTAALASLGFVIALGWAVVPVLIAGGDDTLDPRRFAPLGVKVSRIMPGLIVAAIATLPTAFFAFMWLALSSSWFVDGAAIGTLALAGALVQTVSCVALAKVSASWAARVFANRRARSVALVASVIAVSTLAFLAWRALSRGLETLFEADFNSLIDAIARTPLVSALTAPSAAQAGDWVGAWWRLGSAVVWTVVLLLAWRANVAHALVTPVYRSAGLRGRSDAVVQAARFNPFLSRADREGPAGAVYVRVSRAWRSDPRYITSLTGVILLPALFVALVIPAFDLDPRWAFAAPFVLATSVGWGRHNDVSYDSSALWMDVVAGSRGGAVMRGRFAAVLAWSLPLVAVAGLLTAGWSGHWDLAPAVTGAAIGALGTSLAVAALTSVLLPYRVPAPGENPFGAEVGSVGAGMVGQLASSAATLVLLPLVIVPCVLAIVVDARWGIVAGLGGLGLGAAAYVYGLAVAGRLYDSRAGKLLAAIK